MLGVLGTDEQDLETEVVPVLLCHLQSRDGFSSSDDCKSGGALGAVKLPEARWEVSSALRRFA